MLFRSRATAQRRAAGDVVLVGGRRSPQQAIRGSALQNARNVEGPQLRPLDPLERANDVFREGCWIVARGPERPKSSKVSVQLEGGAGAGLALIALRSLKTRRAPRASFASEAVPLFRN